MYIFVFSDAQNLTGDKNSITIFGQSAGASAVHLFSLIPQTKNLFRRMIASSGSMLNPWAYQKKNHTKILQKHIAAKKSLDPEKISLNEIIEYLNVVNGTMFGLETFAPVYEFGKSIKEIDLVWAPTIERMFFFFLSLSFICLYYRVFLSNRPKRSNNVVNG